MVLPALLNPGYAAVMLLCNECSLFSGCTCIDALHWHAMAQVLQAALSSQAFVMSVCRAIQVLIT
jgi:uncharacterized CHY-type Zn-finger protein